MLVFLTNLTLMEFQARYLVLIGRFWWFWMGNLHKNIQLMLESLKGIFLVLNFSYYTLLTFLMMLSVILLSMLMILLSTLNVIRHLICGNKWDWYLNLNLIYAKRGLGQEVACWFQCCKNSTSFVWPFNNTDAIDMKMDGSVLEGKQSFKMLGALTLSLLLKLPPRKLKHWFFL